MTLDAAQPSLIDAASKRLSDAGVTAAMLIDDAYDTPSSDTLAAGAVLDFWTTVKEDEGQLEQLCEVKKGIISEQDIDDVVIQWLWKNHDNGSDLAKTACEHLFGERLEKLKDVKVIEDNLAALGLKVLTIDSASDLPRERIPKLVFLDYFLGAGDDGNAVNAATAKANALYQAVEREEDKPFVVLMSSKPAAGIPKETFREASELLAGLFGFAAKEDLKDAERLRLKLSVWALDLPARHRIQRFVEALQESTEKARDGFVKRLRGLGLEDYANLQWLSLQPEGQPLGEYMLWLYKALLGYLVHSDDRVLEEQRRLDATSFGQFCPSHFPPSSQLATIYRYAITEPGVQPLSPHPLAEEADMRPLLVFGDLFVNATTLHILLVINAACDLTYSIDAARPFPADRSILLLPGQLQPASKGPGVGCRTDLFEYDGKPYHILWDLNACQAVPYGETQEWFKTRGYERKARLSAPYALAVQHEFASHLTRVGMPLVPPLHQRAAVELHCIGADGKFMMVGEPFQDGAFIMSKRTEEGTEDRCVLTASCVEAFIAHLPEMEQGTRRWLEGLKAQLKAAPEGKDREVLQGKLKGMDGFLSKFEEMKALTVAWLPLVETPTALPKIGLASGCVGVVIDSEKFPSGRPVVLRICRALSPEEAAKVAEAKRKGAVCAAAAPTPANPPSVDSSSVAAGDTTLPSERV
jgi:hypothetical protein